MSVITAPQWVSRYSIQLVQLVKFSALGANCLGASSATEPQGHFQPLVRSAWENPEVLFETPEGVESHRRCGARFSVPQALRPEALIPHAAKSAEECLETTHFPH